MKSIKAVRDVEVLRNVPFYYPEDEELRIELVYEAGRRILPWDLSASETLPVSPMVLVSARSADEVLPDTLKSRVNMTFIGKKEKAREEGKPENMLEKIAQGRLNKFFQESTLLNQAFVKEPKETVKTYMQSHDKDLTVTSFVRFTLND